MLKKLKAFNENHLAAFKGFSLKMYCRVRYRGNIKIGQNFRIFGPLPIIHVSRGGKIIIGNNMMMRNSTRHNYIGVVKPCSIVAVGAACISIGHYVGLSGVSIYAHKQIDIEDHCTIGANVFIIDSNFHSLDAQQRIADSTLLLDPSLKANVGSVKIGRNVFLGLNVMVFKNTYIGENTIIGAASVVTGIIPANEIWAGFPAKPLRTVG